MAPVKLKEVIVYSSQDPVHKVDNLLHQSSQWKRWLCAPGDRSGSIQAEFQLEKAAKIGYVDLGNYGSAFVEVLVRKSSWSGNKYVTLIPATMLMSPMECKNGQNKCGVKMFTKANLSEEGLLHEWDRIKVICNQPYKKDSQFGLAFIRLRSLDEQKEEDQAISPGPTMSKLHMKSGTTPTMNKSPRGRIVMSPSWKTNSSFQRKFMNDNNKYSDSESVGLKSRLLKMASTADNGSDKSDSLSRSAKMVLASSNNKSTPKRDHVVEIPRIVNNSNTVRSPAWESTKQDKVPLSQRRQNSDVENQSMYLPPSRNHHGSSHNGNITHGNKNLTHQIIPEPKSQYNDSSKGQNGREKTSGSRQPTKRSSNLPAETSPSKIRSISSQRPFKQVAADFLVSLGHSLLDSKLSGICPDLERFLGRKLSKEEKKAFKEQAVKRVDELITLRSPAISRVTIPGQNPGPQPKPKSQSNNAALPRSSSLTATDLGAMDFRECTKCFLKFTARQITGHVLDCKGIKSASGITKATSAKHITDSASSKIDAPKRGGGRGRGRGRHSRGQGRETLPSAGDGGISSPSSSHIPTAIMPSYQNKGAVARRKQVSNSVNSSSLNSPASNKSVMTNVNKEQGSTHINSSPPNPALHNEGKEHVKPIWTSQTCSSSSPRNENINNSSITSMSPTGTGLTTTYTIEEDDDGITCPLCNESYPFHLIEAHADLCLEKNVILSELSRKGMKGYSTAELLFG